MRIGALRKRLALQSEGLAPDGAGGSMAVWTTVATVWAAVEPIAKAGAWVDSRFDRRVTHVVTMRWRGDVAVTTGMRLLLGSRVFMIRAVANPVEGNRWLELRVEEDGLLGGEA